MSVSFSLRSHAHVCFLVSPWPSHVSTSCFILTVFCFMCIMFSFYVHIHEDDPNHSHEHWWQLSGRFICKDCVLVHSRQAGLSELKTGQHVMLFICLSCSHRAPLTQPTRSILVLGVFVLSDSWKWSSDCKTTYLPTQRGTSPVLRLRTNKTVWFSKYLRPADSQSTSINN